MRRAGRDLASIKGIDDIQGSAHEGIGNVWVVLDNELFGGLSWFVFVEIDGSVIWKSHFLC